MPRGGARPNSGPKKGWKALAKAADKEAQALGTALKVTKEAQPLFGLTEDQIKTLLPKDLFRLSMQHYVRIGNEVMAFRRAVEWAPYEHARRANDGNMTPQELKQIAEHARSEAANRGFDVEIAGSHPAGALPN